MRAMKILIITASTLLLALAFPPAMLIHAQAMDTIETIAGTGSIGMQDGIEASFHMPAGIMALPNGNILVADTFNNLLRLVNLNGETRTFAGFIPEFFPLGFHVDGERTAAGLHHPTSFAMCTHGRIYFTEPTSNSIRGIVNNYVYTLAGWGAPGFADGPWDVAEFNNPSAIAFNPDGHLYVADTLNHAIRQITLNGHTTTIAGIPGVHGYANGPAGAALFDSPTGIAVAPDGRIFVADTGNHVIRVIENGIVRTLAGSHRVSDDGYYNVGGFSDGTGAIAQFNHPRGLAMWGNNLIVADSANHSIRLISPAGSVTTIFSANFAGDESDALHFPKDVSIHGNRLYIADSGNNKIRMILLQN